MEVVGALASSLQIVTQCGQVTMTIIKWVEAVRTVDDRVDGFVHEVNTLRLTYETLHRSLKDPSMLEAARITNRDVGGHLWTQMSRTLQDCEMTMISITNVLRRIQSSSNILRPVIKQLRESLNAGELSRLREQIVMFNSSLQLPMQMITLTLQLRQQEMTTAHQLQLTEQLTSLRRGIERVERISKDLRVSPRRKESTSGSTLVGDAAAEKTWFDNMESYVGTAKKFLDSASVAATTLSAASTNYHEDDSPIANDFRRGSSFVPLTHQKLKSINMYVEDVQLQVPADSVSGTPQASDAQSTNDATYIEDSDDDDMELQLLQALLHNGQGAVDKEDYANAEDNYREALELSHSNNFGSRLACSATDIALMLGECLVKQEKYDDAIVQLQPLTAPTVERVERSQSSGLSVVSQTYKNVDKGQALSAHQLLGEVYLKKSDYVNAENHAVAAFKGRKKNLGEAHPRTIESVILVIDLYKAKGQNARAEAHKIFLKPVQNPQDLRPVVAATRSPISPPLPSSELVLIPSELSSAKQRKPTFNFSSPFKRAERFESGPTSIPINRMSVTSSNTSPFLVADEFQHLSTSPHDTSSLHTGSDVRPVYKQGRKESSTSNGSQSNVQRWATTSDIVDQYMGPVSHQRKRSSLSKAPTLYAALSRLEMEQMFVEISTLCQNGRSSKAADKGIQLMQRYDSELAILVHRAAELKENIKKSKTQGLAGSGYGFAALHFFCSLQFEAVTEVDILLQLDANPDAIAYKAGYGKVDPFSPLSRAVEKGHPNVVRLLLENGATWNPDVMKMGPKFNADRDSIHPIIQACYQRNVIILELLLDHGMELSEEMFPRMSWHGNSLLHEACFKCDVGMVEFLMSYARRKNLLGSDTNTYSFIGRPGQQDVFGVTPIMYTVDMRDSNDQKLRAHKLRARVECLKILLEKKSENEVQVEDVGGGEVMIDRLEFESPGRLATDLQIEDKRGNTVYWYAEESRGGDSTLRTFLDEQSRRSRLIDI